MTQHLIVGLLVGLAAAYSLWYLLPAAARKRLGRMHHWLDHAPACGSCSDCGKCGSPAADPSPITRPAQEQVIRFHRKV